MTTTRGTELQTVTIHARPLTAESFARYGKVLDQSQFVLESTEFPFFANITTFRPSTEPITYINRHHDHNQIFATFGEPMVVIVAAPGLNGDGFPPDQIEAFVTDGQTAIVFDIDTWHIAPRAVGNNTVKALNVQALHNEVHTERIEMSDLGYRVWLDVG
ncbi:MAG TPA: ureidoglycolate lyase [Chloroflexota bacterium]|nr:ureidoglycolate lyase [Chloroflexota bacterium]